jgi:hypothetical protein
VNNTFLTTYRNICRSTTAGIMSTMMLIVLGLSSGLLQINSVLASDIQPHCQRSFNYSIYLSGLHTGEMIRTENWLDKSAVITTKSEASILGIGSQYLQRTELSWSNISHEWLTHNFHQQVTGFRSRNMQVSIDNNSLESRVDLDGDITTYQSQTLPLRDVDTIAIQIRENILNNRQQFTLLRQASDTLEIYQFSIKETVTTTIAPWGEIQLIPVEQTGADVVTYFFAPSMNYQLVKAHFHGLILQGMIELNSYLSSCDTIKNDN